MPGKSATSGSVLVSITPLISKGISSLELPWMKICAPNPELAQARDR